MILPFNTAILENQTGLFESGKTVFSDYLPTGFRWRGGAKRSKLNLFQLRFCHLLYS